MNLVRIHIDEGRSNPHPALNFNAAAIFTINASLANLLNISQGDKIDFFQDQDRPKDWYMTVSAEYGHLVVFSKSGKYTQRKFQKRGLYDLVKESFSISEKSGSFLIGTPKTYEDKVYYPLILKRSIK